MKRPADYRLTPADTARIQCTAPAFGGGIDSRCDRQATHGQNRGGPPFWYHCEAHATMWRQTGKVYDSEDLPYQGGRCPG